MKQTLQLRLGQHLTMTPQLQQAIRLLQLSTLDLQAEIQEALETNPMLEVGSGDSATADDSWESRAETPTAPATAADSAKEDGAEAATPEPATDTIQDIPDELPVDSNWDDVYDSLPTASTSSVSADDQQRMFENQSGGGESLQQHLIWQMELTPFSPTDHVIAEAIIDSIGDDGYVTSSLEDIQQGLAEEHDVELDEVEAVLHQIQNFDPLGVGARDLRECLLIQLRQEDHSNADIACAYEVVDRYLEMLGGRDYNQILRRMKISREQLQAAVAIIQTMNPRPGTAIASEPAEYITPDVIVKKHKNKWAVELNPETMPKLRVNSQYAGYIKRADKSADNTYMKNQLQEARWFIKSISSRNETLLKVATSIVEHQRGFLEHGEEAMKAMVLHDIADELGMHESTISRVTTKKYMHTPRGVFELKYFFSSHVSTATGGACSSTAIRALIKKLVAAEPPTKPLSDSKLAKILEEQGINIARRTVAKYREAMSIPPSNERRRLV